MALGLGLLMCYTLVFRAGSSDKRCPACLMGAMDFVADALEAKATAF